MVKKRGSLSLSVNAIVILVLAVIIMGFAITFIQKYLREAEVGISGQFPILDIPANAQNPIGIGDNFLIKQGEERRLTLNVFNNKPDVVKVVGIGDIIFDCGSGNNVDSPIVTDAEAKDISPSQSEAIKVVLKGGFGMANNDICKIKIGKVVSTAPKQSQLTQSFFLVTK